MFVCEDDLQYERERVHRPSPEIVSSRPKQILVSLERNQLHLVHSDHASFILSTDVQRERSCTKRSVKVRCLDDETAPNFFYAR